MNHDGNRRRIALLLPGGVSKFDEGLHIPSLYRLVERLSAQFDITVYSLLAPSLASFSQTCHEARIKYLGCDYRAHWAWKLSGFLRLAGSDHLKQRYDLFHGMLGLPSTLASITLGTIFHAPSVISFLGGETASLPQFGFGNLRSPANRVLTRLVALKATKLVLLCRQQQEQLFTWGLHKDDLLIIPHGVDTGMFRPKEKTLQPPYRFIHVANLYPVKDQKTLLRAFQIIQTKVDATLRIIGNDYLNGTIQTYARELGLGERVQFLGQLRNESLPEHYHWAHVMLHTSAHEGGGIVFAEAAACGVVIVGTRVGLLAELAPAGAVAVNVGDYQALAQETIDLLNNPARYNRLREQALRWAHTYNLDWTVDQYSHLYEKLIKNRNDSRYR
jgi:glycosyltransferase involved in cell wall biosynthesis